MSDLTLIQKFVESFIQGEAVLLSNPNLRIEKTFDTLQLLASKEGLIASAKLTGESRSALVRQKSIYWGLMHKTMLGKSYFPAVVEKDGFYNYQHCTIPEGYQMNCTKATGLFQRVWWSRRGGNQRLRIPIDLLILTRGNWYPVRDLDLNPRNETIYIKTLGGDVTLSMSDVVVWLKKVNEQSPNATTPSISERRLGSRSFKSKV